MILLHIAWSLATQFDGSLTLTQPGAYSAPSNWCEWCGHPLPRPQRMFRRCVIPNIYIIFFITTTTVRILFFDCKQLTLQNPSYERNTGMTRIHLTHDVTKSIGILTRNCSLGGGVISLDRPNWTALPAQWASRTKNLANAVQYWEVLDGRDAYSTNVTILSRFCTAAFPELWLYVDHMAKTNNTR